MRTEVQVVSTSVKEIKIKQMNNTTVCFVIMVHI